MVLAASFVFFSLMYGLVGMMLAKRKSLAEKRLDQILTAGEEKVEAEEADVPSSKPKAPMGQRLVTALGKRFAGKSYVVRWEEELETAGIPLKPEEFFVLRLLVALGIPVVLFILQGTSILLPLTFLLGYILPSFYLKQKRAKRLARVAVQLPNALGTMVTSLRAGFSFMQAMQLVGRETADPLGPEFSRTLREISFGVSIEDALKQLHVRLPNDDLELVVTALLIQRTTGGNLAEILDSMQETIRERVKIKEELNTLTAQGRISAWIITLLPAVVGIVIHLMNPEFFTPMLTQPLGWAMLGGSVISGLMGWVFIQKIIRIEV
ncbi:type II secretion system F family protein [Ammoniphilus sp. 3BR4]|uniref:type II secretion system F family protein n=1 Tax=Ammoniphilus sp. 3BR4 TaxID=3158265 RepID=UPI003466B8E6